MRTIIALTLALFVGPALADALGLGQLRTGGSFDLNIANVTAAGSAGGTAASVAGGASIPRNGTTRIRVWSHSDTRVGGFSSVHGACSACGGTAVTGLTGVSNANGGADMNVRNDPAWVSFSAAGDSFGYTEVDRSFELDLSSYTSFRRLAK